MCAFINYLQWLIDTARKHINTVVTKVVDASIKFNRQICAQYDTIFKKSAHQAENTRELVQLQDYVENLRVGELIKLLVWNICHANLQKSPYFHVSFDFVKVIGM